MKLSLNRAELAEALTVAGSVTPSRTPKPALQCVLLDVHEDYAVVSATDLEIGVRFNVTQVQVDQPGRALLPADTLSHIVRETSDEVLSFTLEKDSCHIRGQGTHFQIYSQDAEAFPAVATFEGESDFELEVAVLRRLTECTVFAAARENTRYAINGVLWEKSGETLTLVATDGRRLAHATHDVTDVAREDRRAIVPTKAMQLFARVMPDPNERAGIKISANQIVLRTPQAMVSAALLEGHFPQYNDVIPSDCDKKAVFDTPELLRAVRLVALLTNEESRGIRLAFDKDNLTLSSRAANQGEAEISVPVEYAGGAIDIGFNPTFIIDALKVVSSDKVTFEFKESNRPGVFHGDEGFLYVVMPVNLS